MDYTEKLFKSWAHEDGLTPLFITAEFDVPGETMRLWWLFSGEDLISPREGLCDDEVVTFLSGRHVLTYADRILIDQERLGVSQ